MYFLKQNVNAMFTVRFSRFRLNTYKSYVLDVVVIMLFDMRVYVF